MHGVVYLVLDRALLLLEGRLELVQVLAARWNCKGGGVVRQGGEARWWQGGGKVVARWWQGGGRVVAECERTSRELGLDARLEAGLGLGHELGAHVVPRRVVGRRDRGGGVRQLQKSAGGWGRWGRRGQMRKARLKC